jgi:hypothetical protein
LAEKRYTFNDCEKTNRRKPTTTNSDNAILLPLIEENKTRHERYTKPVNPYRRAVLKFEVVG